jgi:hypothetical protein
MTLTIDQVASHDFKARRGDTFRKPLVFGGTGFDPTDLTGFTARMDIRDPDTGALLISLTTTNGRILMGDTNLTVTLLLTDVETRDAVWSLGVYDFELKDSAGTGDVATYFEGEFCIEDEQTTTET